MDGRNIHLKLNTPQDIQRMCWPHRRFYDKQWEIVNSVKENKETYVVAGNQLGKDYVAAFIVLSFFLRPQVYFPIEYVREVERTRIQGVINPHFVRIITTSVADRHLRVLWDEMGDFIDNSRFPLDSTKGGPFKRNFQDIRKVVSGVLDPKSYLTGQVAAKESKMAGHHAPYTLIVMDEASGVQDETYTQSQGWAKRVLAFGNPFECQNFYRKAVDGGDRP